MVEGRSTLDVSMAIIPKVGGAISLIACTTIMRDVSIKWHSKKSVSLTSVIVFCIALADWLNSLFAAFLSTWMIPADSGYYLASGTTQTCTAQGFVTTLTIGASMSFYAVLMILYWIIVHFGWSESRMSKLSLRLYFILPPLIIPLVHAIPPLFWDMYNHSGLYFCFISPYPLNCKNNPDVPCTRGHGAWEYWDTFWIWALICNMVIITFVCLLIYTVFKQERKTDKYLTRGQEKRRVNTIKSCWQGIRYIGAFMLGYISLYIFMGYRFAQPTTLPPNAVIYLCIILTPLLGFFNACTYFRPRYLIYKENNPDKSFIVCLGNVFNVDLDYLEERRSDVSRRITSLSRRSMLYRSSGVRFSFGKGGDDSSDDDLTSPLFQDSDQSADGSGAGAVACKTGDGSDDDQTSPLFRDSDQTGNGFAASDVA